MKRAALSSLRTSLMGGAALVAVGFALPSPGHANTYTLSDCATNVCTPATGNNLGTVTTTQVSSTEVLVSVSLATGINWVGGGLNSFSFSLLGESGTLSVANLMNGTFSSGWSGLNTGGGNTDGMGTQGFYLTDGLNGNSSMDHASLSFDLVASGSGAALSTGDFVLGGTAPDTGRAYYFLADLYCGGTSCGNTGMTGLVGAVSAVPEPATWAMMLLGFFGLGFAFSRSRRRVSLV
jgi:PEP-CTERM motif